MNRWCAIIFLLLIGWVKANSSNQQDSIKVSLITCEPGNEIYSLFGHTAIRYEDYTNGTDLVYNYGMFSFKTPNFVMRFIKGETDYELGIIPYRYFEAEYAMRGSSVYQQTLNLSYGEKVRLKKMLDDNYLPQNRTYRYNYFYDNCTTRARDKIEECLDGTLKYDEAKIEKSFRDIVHQFTEGSNWDEFGIDLCLGSEADESIDMRKQMFSPFYLLDAFKNAKIVKGDSVRQLVYNESKIVDVQPEYVEKGFFISPFICACILLVICIGVLVFEVYYKKIFWGWDVVMFGAQGIAGCIIAFLFFFSVHPTVGSNWMIMLFNPIPVIYLPFMIYKDIKRKKDLYHYINICYLTLFIVIILLVKQKINITVLPLTLSLMICSLGHILYYRQINR